MRGSESQSDHFEDQFLNDAHEPLRLPFDEEAHFFHPEDVQEEEFHPAARRSKSPSTPTIRSACTCAKWALCRC